MIADLLNLQHEAGQFGPEPVTLPLAADARPLWAAWFNEHAKRIANAETDRDSAALAKLEAYGVRFALIFTLVDDPSAATVTSDAVRRGTALADWFGQESERVYSALAESDDDRRRRKLAEWIDRRGGTVTVRDLTHNLRRFRDQTDEARSALDELASSGFGEWSHSEPGSGRPTERFRLFTDDADTNTPGPAHIKPPVP